nr:recombinase family protein [Ruminococcus sp. OA3]
MYLDEEGARIVRLIFHKYVEEGKGTHVIARELGETGILPMRVSEWQSSVILRILRNEKYCGDLVQKKTYTPDFLSHEKKYNRGQEEYVIIRDHHEPIISREMFEKANRILDSRSHSQKGKKKHSSRYTFSGKIKCGCCGSSYVSRYKQRKDGSSYQSWRCLEAVRHGAPRTDENENMTGCAGCSIRNEDVLHIMAAACDLLEYDRKKMKGSILAVIRSVTDKDNEEIRQIADAVSEMTGGMDYEDEFYRQLLEKIVVRNKDSIDVYLKHFPLKLGFGNTDISAEKP